MAVDLSRSLGPVEDAYERVVSDAIAWDQRHFAREDMVEEEWRIVGQILDQTDAPVVYPRGTWGPQKAAVLPPGGWDGKRRTRLSSRTEARPPVEKLGGNLRVGDRRLRHGDVDVLAPFSELRDRSETALYRGELDRKRRACGTRRPS